MIRSPFNIPDLRTKDQSKQNANDQPESLIEYLPDSYQLPLAPPPPKLPPPKPPPNPPLPPIPPPTEPR